jgi:hypothetical protein
MGTQPLGLGRSSHGDGTVRAHSQEVEKAAADAQELRAYPHHLREEELRIGFLSNSPKTADEHHPAVKAFRLGVKKRKSQSVYPSTHQLAAAPDSPPT